MKLMNNGLEFDNTAFKKSFGLTNRMPPYNYEKYKAINPALSKKMYNFLRGNGTLWKVNCGQRVVMKYENEVLEAVWWLDTPENYANRYLES
jgi:hypothetical protein